LSPEQQLVKEFHEKFSCVINTSPTINVDPELLTARGEFMLEEVQEFREAASNNNLTEMVDALADIIYFAYGTAINLGVDLEPVFEEVHRSNMTKVWPDGSVRRREDGKVIKPPTYTKPDVAFEILKQMRAKGYLGNKEVPVGAQV
jgi:predicted HAD superfamily Cof-like phosphohydrolase